MCCLLTGTFWICIASLKITQCLICWLIRARPKVDWQSLAGVKPRGCLAPEMQSAPQSFGRKHPSVTVILQSCLQPQKLLPGN